MPRYARVVLPNLWRATAPGNKSVPFLPRFQDAEGRRSRRILVELVDLYETWGKPEKAAEYRALLRDAEESVTSD